MRGLSPRGEPLAAEKRAALEARHGVGDATLDDILAKPNRDPREEYPAPFLDQELVSFEDLREGMKVRGKGKNIVDFGAFVDIGIKETALVHVSEMSDAFVKDPMDVLKVGDAREFRVISLDPVRRRIGLEAEILAEWVGNRREVDRILRGMKTLSQRALMIVLRLRAREMKKERSPGLASGWGEIPSSSRAEKKSKER